MHPKGRPSARSVVLFGALGGMSGGVGVGGSGSVRLTAAKCKPPRGMSRAAGGVDQEKCAVAQRRRREASRPPSPSSAAAPGVGMVQLTIAPISLP